MSYLGDGDGGGGGGANACGIGGHDTGGSRTGTGVGGTRVKTRNPLYPVSHTTHRSLAEQYQRVKGTNPALKKPSNIPEIYAKNVR